MDPNVSTAVPTEYAYHPLDEITDMSVKFYAFGSMALVIFLAMCYGVYLVFFRAEHREKKRLRHEKEVCLL